MLIEDSFIKDSPSKRYHLISLALFMLIMYKELCITNFMN